MMKHRTAGLVLALAVCLLIPSVGTAGGGAKKPARPNIVLIMADDMGYSDIGCYGGEIHTPNLNKLAAGGLRFLQFYNTARCCPTRAALMTGLYPHQAGMGWMTGTKTKYEGYQGEINHNCVTIAEVLRRAGYGTYMVGKWHLTHNGHMKADSPKDSWPRQRGFDKFFGTLTGAGSFYTPETLCRDNTLIEAPKGGFYYTDAISDTGASFIRDHARARLGDPFFLYVAYTACHWPLHALKEDIDKYRDRYTKGWDELRKERHATMKKMGIVDPDWKLSDRDPESIPWSAVPEEKRAEMALKMAIYAAQIDRMDQGIGRIVDALKKSGQYENTVIFFLADNGGCAEGGLYGFERMPGGELGTNSSFASYGLGWANASNTPFRLFKHWVHAGGVSTPLIVHWPAGIPEDERGEFRQQPAHLIDIMATCVDLADAKYPAEFEGHKIRPLEGVSLVPAFADKQLDREAIYWEHEGNRAVRAGKWKLVARGEKGAWELYDMEADRTETNNLASKYPQRVEQLAGMWQDYAERAFVLPLTPYNDKQEAPKNPKTSFDFKTGTRLEGGDAPYVAKRPVTIEATIGPRHGDGVIVSQGGNNHGYALFVTDGKPALAVRRNGKLKTLVAEEPLPEGKVHITASLAKGGAVEIQVNGKTVLQGKAGLMTSQPVAALVVGSGAQDSVGDYPSPNRFEGEIERVRIKLE